MGSHLLRMRCQVYFPNWPQFLPHVSWDLPFYKTEAKKELYLLLAQPDPYKTEIAGKKVASQVEDPEDMTKEERTNVMDESLKP